MEIVPLAFDSFGVRSMATYVRTDVQILIDPGVSLAPLRYGLSPHPLELKAVDESWEEIVKVAKRCKVIILTHYHYDHHNPEEELEAIYGGKQVLIKHPTDHINFSQRRRAAHFLKQIQGLPESLQYCDAQRIQMGETELVFSPPVTHGPDKKLGYVVEVLIKHADQSFLFTSDVEGPCTQAQAEFILKQKPQLIFCDGPLSYMLGYRYSQSNMEACLNYLRQIILEAKPECLVIDHHFLRDLHWKERLGKLVEIANSLGCKLCNAAQFIGKEERLLEAKRRELWKLYPEVEYKSRRKVLEE